MPHGNRNPIQNQGRAHMPVLRHAAYAAGAARCRLPTPNSQLPTLPDGVTGSHDGSHPEALGGPCPGRYRF